MPEKKFGVVGAEQHGRARSFPRSFVRYIFDRAARRADEGSERRGVRAAIRRSGVAPIRSRRRRPHSIRRTPSRRSRSRRTPGRTPTASTATATVSIERGQLELQPRRLARAARSTGTQQLPLDAAVRLIRPADEHQVRDLAGQHGDRPVLRYWWRRDAARSKKGGGRGGRGGGRGGRSVMHFARVVLLAVDRRRGRRVAMLVARAAHGRFRRRSSFACRRRRRSRSATRARFVGYELSRHESHAGGDDLAPRRSAWRQGTVRRDARDSGQRAARAATSPCHADPGRRSMSQASERIAAARARTSISGFRSIRESAGAAESSSHLSARHDRPTSCSRARRLPVERAAVAISRTGARRVGGVQRAVECVGASASRARDSMATRRSVSGSRSISCRSIRPAAHGVPERSASKNSNYYAYGTELLAVADGVVAATKDSIPENVPGGQRAVKIDMVTVGGNLRRASTSAAANTRSTRTCSRDRCA